MKSGRGDLSPFPLPQGDKDEVDALKNFRMSEFLDGGRGERKPLDPQYYIKKAENKLPDGPAKIKILAYLGATDAEKITTMVFNKEEETTKRFALLITNPQDPAGEGKFDDWTTEEVATLAHFLMPWTFSPSSE